MHYLHTRIILKSSSLSCDMAKILVTGGAGFIGSNLVDKLIDIQHDIVIIDNLLTGSKDNLNSRAKFYNEDIRNLEAMDKIFKEEAPEYVFHLAAGYLVQSLDNPQRDAEINILGTINLAQLCLKYNIKKIIYSNSGGASYGEPTSIPITEDHSVHPLTPYGVSKYTAEMYLYMFNKTHGLKYTALRYANIYGPRQNPKLEGGVVSIFIDAILKDKKPRIFGDGKQTRDYCYVGDVVDANIMAINKGEADGYNIATGDETSVLDILDKVNNELHCNIEPQFEPARLGDCKRAVFSINKVKREIGWMPKVKLEEGIRKTVAWQKSLSN